MELRRIKMYGGVKSGKAWWIVRPLRSIVWRLIHPYFEGVLEITDERLRAETAGQRGETIATFASRFPGVSKDLAAMQHRLAGLEESLARLEAGAMTQEAERVSAAAGGDSQALPGADQASGTHASFAESFPGVSMDLLAIQHRLAGIEEALQHMPPVQVPVEPQPPPAAPVPQEAEPAAPEAAPAAHETTLEPGDVVVLGTGGLVLAHTATGSRFLVRRHDLIGRIVAGGAEWEPHVRTAIERVSSRGGVAIDAGAYIGLHTVTMSRLFDRVHSFEPQQAIYQLLCGNIVLNDCRNVTVHNLALYDHAGRMQLAPPERQEIEVPMLDDRPDYATISNAAALTFEKAEDAPSGTSVAAITIDQLALEHVSLIKVDTQGADLHVLLGAEETIRRSRPVVLFEWERNLGAQHGSCLDDYINFFERLDYEVSMLSETSPGLQADYMALPR